MTRRVLMIAFHFPPSRGSSAIHRNMTFARFLQEDHDWNPTVLTVHPRAYPQTGDDLVGDIPAGLEVVRAFGCNAARHFAVAGRYPLTLALPDPYSSWWLGGVWAGRRLLRRRRYDAIWSTFPIATAHWIGASLHRRSPLPWIADFQDSMTEDHYPRPVRKWTMWRRLERRTVEGCTRAVFTTPGARAMYAARYPDVPDSRWSIIGNGYGEEPFAEVEREARRPRAGGPLTLVHSGLLYRSERDPRAFFAALGELKKAGRISAATLRIRLRASGDEAYHQDCIRAAGVEDLVSLEPAIDYRAALVEMLEADGLLLLQSSGCNHQIPGKLYEYFRAQRPILALTDPAGDTAAALREAGTGTILRLDSREEIAAGLPGFLEAVAAGRAPVPDMDEVARHSRRARAAELAALLDDACGASPARGA